MTLPEHAICSLMIAQLGVRQRLGLRGVICVTIAGIAPDFDTVSKLFGDNYFWALHHALGHNLLSIVVLSVLIAAVGVRGMPGRDYGFLLAWCLIAAGVHCVTDAMYWWGIQPLWPFSSAELSLNVIEYLDLIVLGIWLSAGLVFFCSRHRPRTVAVCALLSFSLYVALRAVLPPPTGVLQFVAGGWMYCAPNGTPVLDWW